MAFLESIGLGRLDAFHLAMATQLGCDAVITTDDGFCVRSARQGDKIKVRVVDPISLVKELNL